MTSDASGTLFRQRCEFCGAVVNTLRRGRCWGCYQRWEESQPVGKGASCVVCNDRRLDNLQRVELFGRWLPLCHLCAVRSRHLLPMPASVEGIRKALQRERRDDERRVARPDTRLDPKDRRGPDRRAILLEESDLLFVADLPSSELTDLALELVFEPPVGESTLIYEKLAAADLVEATVRRVLPPPPPKLTFTPPKEKVEVEVVEHLVKRRFHGASSAAFTEAKPVVAPSGDDDAPRVETPAQAKEAQQDATQAAPQDAPQAQSQDAPQVKSTANASLPESLLLHATLPPPSREAQTHHHIPSGGLVLFELPLPQPPVPWSPPRIRSAATASE